LVKIVPEERELDRNWERLERALASLAERGGDIDCVVTPECYLDGYVAHIKEGWDDSILDRVAQSRGDSVYLARAADWARRLRSNLVFGFVERCDDGFRNAAALIDRKGEIVGVYHKTHLQSHDLRFLPGRELRPFDADFGSLGIVICADRRWPETMRALRLQGAELIVIPSYGMWHLDNEWWMRTRAYENECFVAFAHPRVAFVASPGGALVAKLQSDCDDILVHRIDLDDRTTKMIRDRRPELYGPITTTDFD
jgi:predicted amidohydrolase